VSKMVLRGILHVEGTHRISSWQIGKKCMYNFVQGFTWGRWTKLMDPGKQLVQCVHLVAQKCRLIALVRLPLVVLNPSQSFEDSSYHHQACFRLGPSGIVLHREAHVPKKSKAETD